MKKSSFGFSIPKTVFFGILVLTATYLVGFIIGIPIKGDWAILLTAISSGSIFVYVWLQVINASKINIKIYFYALFAGYFIWLAVFGWAMRSIGQEISIYWEVGLPVSIFLLILIFPKR